MKVTKENIKALDVITRVLFFPFEVLKYSFKGLSYIKGKITKEKKILFNPDRLEGEALIYELNKVKAQSAEFKKAEQEREEILDKNQKLIPFKYVVKNKFDEEIEGTFDAPGLDEVRVFLEQEYEQVLLIKPRDKWDIDISFGSTKIKIGDLSFFLTQLSTYLKAGITLVDAVRILVKQTQNKKYKRVFEQIVYHLVGGQDFSTALMAQGESFPKLLISMVKTAEMTGDLPSVLDEMADYYSKMEKSRKQMKSALTYPLMVLTVAIGAIIFLIIYVVPQFVDMFQGVGGELPGITVFIIGASNFLQTKGHWALIGIALVVFILRWLFKNNKEFRINMQTFFMKLPAFGDMIIYNEVHNLTRTFATLLSHGVFITDSMEILSNITDNEVYKDIINRCLIGLSKGSKISETFHGEWAFPVVAYEMLVTGETTGQLATMMEKVSEYYGELHENAANMMKSLIEPIVILLLSVAVGFILLSIIIPMFKLYTQI